MPNPNWPVADGKEWRYEVGQFADECDALFSRPVGADGWELYYGTEDAIPATVEEFFFGRAAVCA